MRKVLLVLLMIGSSILPAEAIAQQPTITQTIAGTRLDISASGEVTQAPDIAVVSAGVVTHSQTASGAIQEAAEKMQRVIAALKRSNIAERDIQTSNISLNPEYRYDNNQPPQLVGYTASNQVTVRFRDIRSSGKILDALVSEGSNQISGPNLIVDKPDAALDQARAKAIAAGRARAELYARSLGLKVVRIVAVSENGSNLLAPVPVMMAARGKSADTPIETGEQKLEVTLAMTFELQ